MAAIAASPTTAAASFFPVRTPQKISPIPIRSFISSQQLRFKVVPSLISRPSNALLRFSPTVDFSLTTTSNGVNCDIENRDLHPSFELEQRRPIRFLFWVLVWASLSLVLSAAFGVGDASAAAAAADSIRASSFGLKVATALRGSGWPAEAVVFALATLPVVELRGAIPVGYWLQLKPLLLTLLSVLGNMVPVPFIVLYLKKFTSILAQKNPSALRFLDLLFERAREKAGPVEEFQWLGLMLFVAVPFPGTGAWTGAMIASILDMPFWSAISANFCGVVLAGLLVNLLVNLGLKYAVVTGVILFFISTFMWSILRNLKRSLSSSN